MAGEERAEKMPRGEVAPFEFATATRILFGPGTARTLGAQAGALGSRAVVALGIPEGRAAPLLEELTRHGVGFTLFPVKGEPTVELARQGARLAVGQGYDLVIGLGGGSAIDSGKAIAALAANPGDPLDYLEVIGQGHPLLYPPLPFIAIPTTAGTGAEVTRNAVLGSPEHAVKVSLRSAFMLPRLALVDPELTYGLPPAVTASSGLDALTQLLEAFVSLKANPMTDAVCREGLGRAARSLVRAYTQDDPLARQEMALASLLGGLALANAALGAVHGFAGPLGGMFPAPHGAVCARLLPFVMQANLQALQARQPQSPTLERYAEIARILTASPQASAAEGVSWIEGLCATLQGPASAHIPPLSAYGLAPAHLPEVIEKSARASSMKGNPVVLTPEEMATILERAL